MGNLHNCEIKKIPRYFVILCSPRNEMCTKANHKPAMAPGHRIN